MLVGNNESLINFEGFENLKEITGLFLINNNKKLKDLKGLINLTFIGGELRVTENDNILNFTGLQALTFANHLAISKNPILTSCTGMPNLVKIKAALNIGRNPKLKDCNGFNSLKIIEDGYMNIYENISLVNLNEAFPSLEIIGGKLQISSNNQLFSINGFKSIHKIGYNENVEENRGLIINNNLNLYSVNGFGNLEKAYSISISSNGSSLSELDAFKKVKYINSIDINGTALKAIHSFSRVTILKKLFLNLNPLVDNISGLRNIKSDSLEYVRIRENMNLSACNLKFLCDFLENNPQSNYIVTYNKPGCNYGKDPFPNSPPWNPQNSLKCDSYVCSNSRLSTSLSNFLCVGDSAQIWAECTGKFPIKYLWHDGKISNKNEFKVDLINYFSILTEDGDGCRNFFDSTYFGRKVMKPEVLKTDETCFDCSNGKISIKKTDQELNILWADQDTSFVRNNLHPGTYHYTLNNKDGCYFDSVVVILPFLCQNISYKSKITNALCYNQIGRVELDLDSTILIDKFLWSTGSVGPSLLAKAGTYYLDIITSDQCVYHDTFIITQPALLGLNIAVSQPTCHKYCNGKTQIGPNGGTGPYYSYSDGNIFIDSISNLCQGKYLIKILDANSCSVDTVVDIIDPMQLPITFNGDTILCFGEKINLSVIEEYDSYLWSTNEVTKSIEVTKSGIYDVSVVSNNCVHNSQITIFENSELIIEIKLIEGEIVSGVIGGTPPYKYYWSTGDTTSSITLLNPQEYILKVVDFNGCSVTNNILVSNTINHGIENTLTVSPNPVSTTLLLTYHEEVHYTVFDLLGHDILNGVTKDNSIDVYHLAAGIYLLKVNEGINQEVIRFVKE